MIQVYANGKLVYDPRLPDRRLLALSRTGGVNKSGTVTLTMPPNHPAYDNFISFKTPVEVYKDSVLVFRGRALYPSDDFYKCRTITCEGERGFFQDSVMRPYLYQDTPAVIFAAVVGVHNSQVDADKQFVVGEVTVTDPNDYIRLENTQAEQVSDTINKLVERCGGYIVFNTNEDGQRVVNWYKELNNRSRQTIEFGKNLTDFTKSDDGQNLATAILPYGAKLEPEDGAEGTTATTERVTIESVNDGVDFIQDDEAVALRGFILKPVYWDDVTEPANLLAKAQEWLASNRNVITSMQLTAVDLSNLGLNVDTFQEGDLIQVISKPHKVDENFMLTEMTEDFLTDSVTSISLGKEHTTLTGLSAKGDHESASALDRVERNIREEYTKNTAASIEETMKTLTSLIRQTGESILLSVEDVYQSKQGMEEYKETVSAKMLVLSESITAQFKTVTEQIESVGADVQTKYEEIIKCISLSEDGVIIVGGESGIQLQLDNEAGIVFSKNGVPFGTWDGQDFYTGNIVVRVEERAQFGDFAFIPRTDGSIMFLKVGGE